MFQAAQDNLNVPPGSCAPSTSTLTSDIHNYANSTTIPSGYRPVQSPLRDSRAYPHVSAIVGVHAPKGDASTGQSTSRTTTLATSFVHKCTQVFKRLTSIFTRQPIGHSLLHNGGLKTFSFKRRYKGANGQEIPKPVFVKSRVLAITSLVIHILPISITVFLISLNAISFINGPPITTIAQYALQGASKFHELTIVASLARVITDILRYHLVRDGVNLGLLSSPFSFLGLNFLWSQELFSATQSAVRLKSKAQILFLILLVGCCFLAAVAGPASALLFLPSAAWLSSGSTELFLIGTENDLWPQHLTWNHTGPSICVTDPVFFFCLQGGWDAIQGFVTPEGTAQRITNVGDGWTPRTMWLWRQGGTDSWASTLHGATVYLAERRDKNHGRAWDFAKGRQRRLRDGTVSGFHQRVTGRIPVVRVLCGPAKPVNDTSPTLSFPILDANRPWRVDDNPGPHKELQMNGTYKSLINATFTLLPAEFGTSTAGLAFVTNHPPGNSAGCGCSIDARWAQGHSTNHNGSPLWQAFIGLPMLPEALKFQDLERNSIFDPNLEKFLGPSLTADDAWIRNLSIGYQIQDYTGNFTALETILVSTRLWDVPWVLNDKIQPYQELEAVVSAFFVNALSRVGWALQIDEKNPSDPNPMLRVGSADNDHLLHDGGQIWERPDNVSTQALKQEWFVYATAWQLRDPAIYFSVVALGIHLLIVLIHGVAVVWSEQSSEAWNSISELIALAYTSSPDHEMLKNCGAAIMLQKTLGEKVKVVTVEDHEISYAQKLQLVPCDNQSGGGSLASGSNAVVIADREYT